MVHRLHAELLRRAVRVLVIGCGGTGSAVLSGLPYLHQAMLALGHPGGLEVTVMDGDRISPVNCVRQPFSEGEVGLFKAVVLVNRLNLDSRNSSKPPSTDPHRKRNQRPKNNNKPGGQTGHVGTTLRKVDNPDAVEMLKVDRRTIPAGKY